jgi:hypothetical protein
MLWWIAREQKEQYYPYALNAVYVRIVSSRGGASYSSAITIINSKVVV